MNVLIKTDFFCLIISGDASSVESQIIPSMTILAKDPDQVTIQLKSLVTLIPYQSFFTKPIKRNTNKKE
jgi:hypothetical protein